ncbi:serine/threonine kinase 3 [Paragonimus westermani]|uniref:Serine/threonine kinase 3 n=1 Tax=Paragonimus westermani TaxID=34504 RepID=A0A5J4NRB9_9TREM|nr:serine/threonine kinase 3 [Paragonimus westermani]
MLYPVPTKQVPVDSDLTDIVKEISIMQQCDSPFIVKCYGSMFDSQDLWICMEYCGAGSIADIMRLRGKTLAEDEIATVLRYSLQGLDYLHQMRKIHRDIKAGNILLLNSGASKLADFGVAGQLSDTLAKRNTVIGTPYWMAPEVIQEIGYNYSADIWSLGITAIEIADGKPPLADVHPMRALFMIPSQPPPTLRKPGSWSAEFRAFVTACLAKTPEARPTAAALLQTEFIRNSKPCSILLPLIAEANAAREKRLTESKAAILSENVGEPEENSKLNDVVSTEIGGDEVDDGNGTMVRQSTVGKKDKLKRVRNIIGISEDRNNQFTVTISCQFIHPCHMLSLPFVPIEFALSLRGLHDAATAVPMGSFKVDSNLKHRTSSPPADDDVDDLGTMVINPSEDEGEEEDSGSVVVHDTASSTDISQEENEDEHMRERRAALEMLDAVVPAITGESTLTRRANNGGTGPTRGSAAEPQSHYVGVPPVAGQPFGAQRPFAPFSRALQQSGLFPGGLPNEPGALNRLSYAELQQLLATLTVDLETELRNLAVRYRHKRQPLLDAIAEKTAQAAEAKLPDTSRSGSNLQGSTKLSSVTGLA